MKPVMHACGHDMHMTCLLAAADFLANIRDHWKGTLIVLFQPNEERGGGANAMVNDGLYNIVPVPDCVLGQHVMAMRAGNIGSRPGTIMTASNRFKVTLFGRGGHGSMPHVSIHRTLVTSSASRNAHGYRFETKSCSCSSQQLLVLSSKNNTDPLSLHSGRLTQLCWRRTLSSGYRPLSAERLIHSIWPS